MDNVCRHCTEGWGTKDLFHGQNKITENIFNIKIFGLPTKYELIKPQYLLFEGECGCNTNQKGNKAVGEELFVMPTDGSAEGIHNTTTDIHFSALGFTAGTDESVMCAVTMKSKTDILES